MSIKTQLIKAHQILSNLNLYQASKWCAEAISGLADTTDLDTSDINLSLSLDDIKEYDRFILAKSYFNVKEFDRCVQVLISCKSPNCIFLKLYASLLSIDKRNNEETDGSINVFSIDNNAGVKDEKDFNKYSKYSKIIQEIENWIKANPEPDFSFLYYLLGSVYNKKKNYQLSQKNLIKSLVLFPYNWSCWQELIDSIVNFDESIEVINTIKSTDLYNNIMFQIFEVVLSQEFYQPQANITNLNYLLTVFPKFNFLKIQDFLIHYHNLDYYQAEKIFDQILIDDPLRLDDLDTYSNMLYVMEKKSKLSYLAQYSSNIDKFKPETCCIIANYHSMKGEHEKAIMYYKRALILNKNSLSAWTLMGHEFVELKNSHAAIESYRRAVDINAKDFRAWYGLGQAYEVLDMHLYSLYYYQRATNLQPLDKRMWQAIGNCFEKIGKFDESIKSFEKALTIDLIKQTDSSENVDPFVCYKLASIYEKLNNTKQCFKFMKLCFDQEFEWGITDETSKARLWLARNALENSRFEEAYELTKDLNHNNAHDIEEARAITREARNRMNK